MKVSRIGERDHVSQYVWKKILPTPALMFVRLRKNGGGGRGLTQVNLLLTPLIQAMK